jgi:hypothetical protein
MIHQLGSSLMATVLAADRTSETATACYGSFSKVLFQPCLERVQANLHAVSPTMKANGLLGHSPLSVQYYVNHAISPEDVRPAMAQIIDATGQLTETSLLKRHPDLNLFESRPDRVYPWNEPPPSQQPCDKERSHAWNDPPLPHGTLRPEQGGPGIPV